MSSPLLALFARSLREDVRLKMTYVSRAGLVAVILLFLLTYSQSGAGNAPGLQFFSTVIFINAVFVMLAGFSYFASAITEEKEEMTLGLLRMTNLNPLSILLGKSTSRLFGALMLLVAQFPFTLLAVSLGGVSLGQIFAAYVTLGAFIFFVANLALFASVVCHRSRGASILTGAVLFILFWGIPLLARMVGFTVQMVIAEPSAWVSVLRQVAEWVEVASPFDRLSDILRTGFSESPWSVQVWSNLALGAGFFLLAWAVFDLFCDEKEATQSRGFLARRTSRLRALGAGRTWPFALAWKDFYFLVGGRVWMAIKLAAYGLGLLALFYVLKKASPTYDHHLRILGYATCWLSIAVICLELAFTAAGLFAQERRWKTLSSLAMLPMSMRQIAYQKILGSSLALVPACLCLAFGVALVSEEVLKELGRVNWNSEWSPAVFFGFSYAGLQGVFFLHLIVWLSLYLGRGALPAAIALQFVLNLFLGIISSGGGDATAPLLMMCVVTFFGVLGLHAMIGHRLLHLAAEE